VAPHTRDDLAGRAAALGILGALLVLGAVLASCGSPVLQRTVIEGLIKLTVVIGLSVFVGNSGVISFGHVGFMAVGGYVSAVLTLDPDRKAVLLDLPAALEAVQLSGLESAAIVAAAAALVAVVVGIPLMRLRGIALPMATFGLLVIGHVVSSNWREVTGGRQALVGLPRFTDLWVALGVALLSLVVAFLYQRSRRGLLLRCSREDETAAAATGIRVGRERLLAFVLSAVIVALGGMLFAHFLGTVTANTFYLDMTFITLAMLVVGGMHSLTGAVVGTVVLSLITEIFRSIERGVSIGGQQFAVPPGLQEIAVALILLAILLFRPKGIVGDHELSVRFRRLALPGRAGDERAT
jgi:branched-chain amino acid transport system permease protein